MENINTLQSLVPQKELAIIAPGTVIKHYSKDAKPLSNVVIPTSELEQHNFILIKGVVRNPEQHCNEMFQMLEEGKVIALEKGRGSSFEHMKDESVLFHALIPKQTNSEYKEVLLKGKEWLRKAFAGWHHAYHEVFAAAQVLAIQAL